MAENWTRGHIFPGLVHTAAAVEHHCKPSQKRAGKVDGRQEEEEEQERTYTCTLSPHYKPWLQAFWGAGLGGLRVSPSPRLSVLPPLLSSGVLEG